MIVILGSGVIARAIARELMVLGETVIVTSRTIFECSSYKSLVYDALVDDLSHTLKGIDVSLIINCAYSFTSSHVNEVISQRLVDYLRLNRNVHCVNISSMSSFSEAISQYGREKYLLELFFLKHGIPSIRIGLPKTEPAIGLLSTIEKIEKSIPFVTFALSTPGSFTFLTPIPELTKYIYKNYPHLFGVSSYVSHEKVDMVSLTKGLTNKHLVKVNWRFALHAIRLLEHLGFRLRFGSDSILGLVYANKTPERNLF